MVSGPTAMWAASAARGRPSALEIGESGRAHRRHRCAGDHLDAARADAVQRRTVAITIVGEHQPGPHRGEDLSERRVLPCEQRVGRGDRRIRHAAVHRGERQQRVLDAVPRQNDDRPLDRQCAVEQPGGNRADALERRSIRHVLPAPFLIAATQERPVRRVPGPVLEAIGQPGRIGRQRMRRPGVHHIARGARSPCRTAGSGKALGGSGAFAVQVPKRLSTSGELGQERGRRPAFTVVACELLNAGVDGREPDPVGMEHRTAAPRRKAVAVDVDHVDVGGALGRSILEQSGRLR